MIERPTERRPPLSPQLAMRVAILGGVAFVLFGIILFRLWYLQILSGDQYIQLANNNRVRDVRIAAPRGQIVDRNGSTVVDNRQATIVQIVRQDLPADAAARTALYRRLGTVLQMSPARIRQTVDSPANLSYADVTVKTDAGQPVLDYLAERQVEFPGVSTPPVFLRAYPFKDVAAQLLGNIGEINTTELKLARFRGLSQGTVIGKAGVEWTYDRYLRGRDGARRVQVDALGRPRGTLSTVQPLGGHELKLSIDLGLQRAAQSALRQGIGLAQGIGHPANAGAFVAIDPRNGAVLALGSSPSFDPNVFAKPLSQAKYRQLSSQATGAPLFDRAIDGAYPTGSTFKPITALASLQNGLITPDTPYSDAGCITVGSAGQKFCNAGKTAHGTISLRAALQVSSDVFFYHLGEIANPVPGEIIQSWAHRLGLGVPTGIDLPGEFAGTIPDRAWRQRIDATELRCEQRRHVRSCGISDGRPWTVGDNVNLAVGQGDLQVTPLQLSVAYAAIINGGTVVRPHLGLAIDDAQGRLLQTIAPAVSRHVSFDPANRQAIMDGLLAATSQPGGTSYDVMHDFPIPVYGKTGTAQRAGQDDQSWYVCYATDGSRPIVIAVTIEKGGFGDEAAAPAARLMLSQWFHVKSKLVAGHSATR